MTDPTYTSDDSTPTCETDPSWPPEVAALYGRLRIVAQLMRDAPAVEGTNGLRILWRDAAGKVHTKALEQELLVGRAPTCELQLPHPRVSRRHCRMWLEAGEVWLEDTGSTAGTLLNGRPIQRAQMREGDLIAIGPCALTLAR